MNKSKDDYKNFDWDTPWNEVSFKTAGKALLYEGKKFLKDSLQEYVYELQQDNDPNAVMLGVFIQQQINRMSNATNYFSDRQKELERVRNEKLWATQDLADKFVDAVDRPFIERLRMDFPKPKVVEINEEEKLAECERVKKIRDRIIKANHLEYLPIRFTQYNLADVQPVDGNIYRKERDGLPHEEVPVIDENADIVLTLLNKYEKKLNVNPLFTKTLKYEELAFVISHEFAHHMCYHTEECAVVLTALQSIDDAFSLNKKDPYYNENTNRNPYEISASAKDLINALQLYHECEADCYARHFCEKAGFPKINDLSFLDNYLQEDNAKLRSFSFFTTHPHKAERNAMLEMVNPKNIVFDKDEQKKYFESVLLQISSKLGCVRLERETTDKVMPIVKLVSENFLKRVESYKDLPKEERIKYLSFFSSFKKFYKNRDVNKVKLPSNRQFLKDFNEAHLKKLYEISDSIVNSVSLKDRMEIFRKRLKKHSNDKFKTEIKRGTYRYLDNKLSEGR